jgi:hypothetical protein
MEIITIVFPLLFWFGLPMVVADRIGGHNRSWLLGTLSWIGVYIVWKQQKRIDEQSARESHAREAKWREEQLARELAQQKKLIDERVA